MDFQRGWGASYSTASLRDASENLYQQARALLEGPFQTSPDTPMLEGTNEHYIEVFNDYFGVDPMIFTMHASEAQYAIYSLYFASLEYTPFENEEEIPSSEEARLAWTTGCYGASFGPGAYISPVPGFSRSSWGMKPYVLDIDGDIEAGVLKAKSEVSRIPDSTLTYLMQWKRSNICVRGRIALPLSPKYSAAETGGSLPLRNGQRSTVLAKEMICSS
jgi:hypothetical protein